VKLIWSTICTVFQNCYKLMNLLWQPFCYVYETLNFVEREWEKRDNWGDLSESTYGKESLKYQFGTFNVDCLIQNSILKSK